MQRLQRKALGTVFPHLRQQVQKRQRVLSARNADRDAVALLDHMIVLNAAAKLPHQFLHG